jgi:hypothetical protein
MTKNNPGVLAFCRSNRATWFSLEKEDRNLNECCLLPGVVNLGRQRYIIYYHTVLPPPAFLLSHWPREWTQRKHD